MNRGAGQRRACRELLGMNLGWMAWGAGAFRDDSSEQDGRLKAWPWRSLTGGWISVGQ